jgi:PKD repeat protein
MGSPNPMSTRGRFLAAATTFAVVSALFAFAAPAQADTAPPVSTDPATVSTDALPTPQINGVVWSQVVVGNTDYVAGNFTSARPFGSAAGTNETPRSYLLAYDVTTGVLQSWAPTVNGQIRALSVSPDKTRLYAVGDFTTVNGVARNRIAAFDLPSNSLDMAFHPSANASIYAVTSTNSTVYFGGTFSAVGGLSRVGTAAASASNGTPTAWNPVLGSGRAFAMTISPDGSKIVIGGAFTTMNGSSNPGYGLGMVDSTSGANLPFGTNNVVRNGGTKAAVFSLTSDSDSVYGTGYVFGDGGNLEGTFRSDWNGDLKWIEDCHGDEYSVAVQDSTIYIAGHPHYCGNIGGFPQTSPTWTFHRALAFSKNATGTITHDPNGYFDFAGNPSPTQLNWFPDINLGTFTGQNQGPWSVASSPNYIVYGGEFTQVNSKPQQGLVRFATKAIAPNLDGPRLFGDNLKPTVQSNAAGTATVSWSADWDRDNESLTYQVYRDGKTATAAYTTTVSSRFWDLPTISWIDTGLTPGAHTYRVRATDPFGNTAWGTTVSVSVAATGTLSSYAKGIIADQPTNFWRLDDSAGTTSANDSVGRYSGTVGTGVTFGQPGAIVGDPATAAAFDGTSNGLVASSGQVWGSNTFTIETWINTTTSTGGKIVGFGDKASGTSSSYDRHVYMTPAGNLAFGVYPNSAQVVQSAKKYNDGQWHHVVASLSTSGMQLYVDGLRVGYNSSVTTAQNYFGYWRIGGDSSWAGDPFIKGSIDDTAIYPTALTSTQIVNHYSLSGRTVNQPVAPADAYGAAVFAQQPLLYYRLGETTGTTAVDSSGQGNPGIYSGDVTLGATGAIRGTSDTAATFTNGVVASSSQFDNPTTYSTQIWFKTNTTVGGKLTGFGNSQTGNSNSYDRHVYMQNDGTLVFGTYTGQLNEAISPLAYNDNKWHMATATQGSDGMKLYVDDALVATNSQTNAQGYSGYWLAGSDPTWGSTNQNFTGTLDDFAVYPNVLSASTIANLYSLGAPVAANVLPTAAFTSTVTGKSVALDASTSTDTDGTVVSYAWDFGDGTSQVASASATASHTYTTAGSYIVTLTVIDNSGGSATANHLTTIVQVNNPPSAIFSQSAVNLAASFDATGSSDSDGTIAAYAWDFGDGAPGTGATASHTYAAGGTYSVTLTVTDNQGATTSVIHSLTVTPANVPPTANLTSTNTAGTLIVGFDAGASTDPDGTIASYDIDYGDGSAHGTTVTSTHTYAAAGTYTAGLAVTDNQGAVSTFSLPVTITKANAAPVAAFTSTVTNLTASFNGAGSTDDGTITAYAWNYGDGTSGTGVSPTHTYTTAGTYTATLVVTDNGGLTGTTSQSITATATPTTTTLAEDHFDRSVTSSWGSALTGGAWTVSSAANASVGSGVGSQIHAAGVTRTAVLKSISATDMNIVTDVSFDKTMTGGGAYAGIIARQSTSDYYQARVRFLVGGTMSIQVLQGGSTVLATGTVAGTYTPGTSLTLRTLIAGTSPTTISAKVWPTGTAEPTAWQVTTTSSAAGLQTAGSIGVVSYASAMITNAPLTAKYDNFVAFTGTGAVVPPPANVAPTAAFTATASDLVASFNGNASTDTDGTIAGWAWNFGDGTTGTGATTTHTYAAAGTYSATLTVTDNGGATGVKTSSVTVTAPVTPPANLPPTAVIATSANGLTTLDNANSSSDPDGTIVSYAWTFGDGSTGTGQSTSHVYAVAGTYPVTLTVTDNSGATAVASASVTVSGATDPNPPIAADTFARTSAAGWGSADLGGVWNTPATTNFVVGGGSGAFVHTAGSLRRALLTSVNQRDVEMQATIQPDKGVSVGLIVAGLVARQVGSDFYQGRVLFQPNNVVQIQLLHGSSTVLTTVAGGPGLASFKAGDPVILKVRVSGVSPTTIQAKLWLPGQSEPTAWQATTTDSTPALQVAGPVGFESYISTGATNAPVTVKYSAYSVRIAQ